MNKEYVNYTFALQKRLEWLKYSWEDKDLEAEALPIYRNNLVTGETYFMNSRFCQLVDYARHTVPDDLKFEREWLISPNGWMWLEEPFEVPRVTGIDTDGPLNISAIGWSALPEDDIRHLNRTGSTSMPLKPGAIQFMCYLDVGNGFSMWAHFCVSPGDKVLERLYQFENHTQNTAESAEYVSGRETELLHEIRWIYTAMHMMSQKLAMTVTNPVNRGWRRRMEREKSPVTPMVRIVTLRRLEADRKAAHAENQVEWNWHWRVHGFWRNQWFPGAQEHRQIWIEDYIKGDMSKPLKQESSTIYVARR